MHPTAAEEIAEPTNSLREIGDRFDMATPYCLHFYLLDTQTTLPNRMRTTVGVGDVARGHKQPRKFGNTAR